MCSIIILSDRTTKERKNAKTMKYKHIKTGRIGEVISDSNTITPVLRFEDGSEMILTPANLKKYYEPVEEEVVPAVTKLTYAEFEDYMKKWNSEHKEEITGVLVFKQKNFGEEYTEEQRSYRVSSNNGVFKKGRDKSLVGSCLDGTDDDLLLSEYNWSVEFCYLEN